MSMLNVRQFTNRIDLRDALRSACAALHQPSGANGTA